MKISVRYYTRSGNTEKLAKAVAKAIGTEALDLSTPLSEKVDLLFLGCSYYAFDVDQAVKDFLRQNKDQIGTIVCFGTAAMMRSMKKTVAKVAEPLGIAVDAEEFYCKGSFGPMHKGKPDQKDLDMACVFAKTIIEKKEKQA